jgi:hypothetical protein
MNVCPPFVAYPQAAKLMQPTQDAFYHPSIYSQATAMRLPTPGQQGQDVAPSQLFTHRLRVVGSVPLGLQWSPPWSALLAFYWRNRIDQDQSLGNIVDISSGQPYCQGDALAISDDVMLAPPKTARTEALSRTARRQSIRSADCKRSRHTRWMRSQTPPCCQSRSLRQQSLI